MNDKKLILEFDDEHGRLVKLFNGYRENKQTDFAKAKEIFMEFSNALQKHMLWEERILFPILRNKSSSHDHIMELIIREHIKILADLSELHKKIENNINSEQDEEKLIIDLLKHEEFEDEVFHPAIIQLLKENLAENEE